MRLASRLALAAQLVRGGARVGQQHGALAFGVGADALRRLGALGARLRGDALAFRLHARQDRLGVLLAAGRRGGCARPRSATPKPCISAFTWSRIVAMIRSRSADSTSSSLLLPSTRRSAADDDRIQPAADAVLDRADRLVVAQRIGDAEHGEAVDDQPALVAQDHLLARQFEVEQPLVEADHRLHERRSWRAGPGSSITRTGLPNWVISTCSV